MGEYGEGLAVVRGKASLNCSVRISAISAARLWFCTLALLAFRPCSEALNSGFTQAGGYYAFHLTEAVGEMAG